MAAGSAPTGAPSATPGGAPEAVPAPVYQKNAAGETYGSSANATPLTEPDLISAIGTNAAGQTVDGYVRKGALNKATGADVSSPAQAAKYMAAITANPAPVSIPLYAKNGSTVIGSFTVTISPGTQVYPTGSPQASAPSSAQARRAPKTRH